MSNALSHFEQEINILLQNNPDVERSANVSQGINSAISCYNELQKEAKTKARQTTLDKFLKPGPSTSTTTESDDDIAAYRLELSLKILIYLFYYV